MWSMTVGGVAVSSRRACFGVLLRGGRGIVDDFVVIYVGDWFIVLFVVIVTLPFISLVFMLLIVTVVVIVVDLVTHSFFYPNFTHLIIDAIPLTQPSSKHFSISSRHSITLVSIPP